MNGTNNKSTVLNKLNEFTTYEVAIQAATSKGAGKHGEIKTNTTLQDGKCMYKNKHIVHVYQISQFRPYLDPIISNRLSKLKVHFFCKPFLKWLSRTNLLP